MAIAGHPPLFCAAAKVRSLLPDSERGAGSQRTRWEHGQLATLASRGPRLLAEGLRQRRPELIALALDLMVPPLALLSLSLAGSAAASGAVGALFGRPLLAMLPSLTGLGMVGGGTLVAWSKYARQAVPLRVLLMTPAYVGWKIPMYIALAVKGRQKSWVRTERGSVESASDEAATVH
jgi:hypothetical protein